MSLFGFGLKTNLEKMDWNVGSLQNTDAQNNLQSQEVCYTQVLSNAQVFSQANAYPSENGCNYTGNNQMMFLPTSNINIVFTPVNPEGYKNSDQTFSGASVAGSSFATSEYSVDRCPPSRVPLAPKPPNHSSRAQAQIAPKPWQSSKTQTYSRRKFAPFPQMNSGNNVQNIPREPQNQYVATNGYTTRLPVPQLNPVRTTMLHPSSRKYVSASKMGRPPSYSMNTPSSSQGISVPIDPSSGQYAHSQNNSLSRGTSGQHIQNQIYYPSNQFQVSHSQNQNNTVNVSLPQYVPSQMTLETRSGCSAPPLLPAICDSRASTQPLLGLQQAVQNVSSGYTLNQQKQPSDRKNAACFNGSQQYWQKRLPGEVSQSVRNVCNMNGNVTANQPFNEMSTSSPGISEIFYDIVQEIGKPPNDTTSVQESQTPNLINAPVNTQMPLPTDSGKTVTKERLAWEARKLLSIKKKCLLLEKVLHYKKNLLAASEPDKNTSILTPCSQNTVNFLSQVPNQNVAPSLSETMRTGSQQHPILNSSSGERNDKSMTNVDNIGLEMTPGNHQMDQGSFSSSSLPIPAQSELPTQLNNPERAPISEPKDAPLLTSSQKTLTSSQNTSRCTQTDNPFKMAGKNMAVQAGNSSFLQFVLSSTNILKEKKAGATADKILTSLLCNEKPPVGLMGSDGSLLQDTTERNVESLKDEQAFIVHATPPVALGSAETNFQKERVQKKAPFTENSSSEQNNCPYSVEELTACLGLWRKRASEPVNVQNKLSNESPTANPMSLLPCTQNTTNNREENNVSVGTNEVVLSSTTVSVGQKHETCSNLVKSFELQVAVVSPLVLSDQRTQNEETDKFPTLANVTYPVIEAGSICSLLKEGKNVLTVVNTEKETIETVPSSPDDCVLVEKVDLDLQQTKSADGNEIVEKSVSASHTCDINQRQVSRSVQDARDSLQLELPDESSLPELGVDSSSQIFQDNITGLNRHKDKQVMLEQGNTSTTMLEDVLHISSVCSLVEGDTFYNPQIASMFNSAPVTNTLNNGSSLEDNACDQKQREQKLDLYKDDVGLGENFLQGEGFLQMTLEDLSGCMSKTGKVLDGITIGSSEKASSDGFPKTLSTSEQKMSINTSCKHPENDFENFAATNLELTQNSQDSSLCVSAETAMLTVARDSSKQDYPSGKNSVDEDFKDSDLFGEEPFECLHDQLTELVKEFPYGIEGANMLTKYRVQSDSVVECTTDQPQKEAQTCKKSSDPVNQVQTTLLKSEQMRELSPEPNQHNYSESHKATSQQTEEDSSEKENLESNTQSGQSLCKEKEKTDTTSNPEREKKDYCCLMGWFSAEYTMPPCSCKSSISASGKNQSDHQISETENATSKEIEESNDKSDSKPEMNSAMGDELIETFQNGVDKNKKGVSKHTSLMNKEARTKVSNEFTPPAVQQDNTKPFNSSAKQDVDKSNRNNWKEELQIYRRTPLLGKESHSVKKDHQNVSKEELSSGKRGCTDATDADNMTLPKKKERICKMEALSKDKTEIGSAVKGKTDIHKSKNSETVEIKHSEVNQEHKNKICEEKMGREKNGKKQEDKLGKEVAVSVKDAKLSAEIKHKKLNSYRSDASKFPNFSNVDLKSRNHKYSQHKSIKTLPSQESSYKQKRKENMIGKKDPKKPKLDDERLKQSEAKNSKQLLHNQMKNTDKTKNSTEENVRKHKSSLADHSVLKLQKKMGQSSTGCKNYFSNRERHLDGQNKDKSSEKIFSDKNLLYLNRRNNRLKMYLQKEPKKHYLNRVAFKRTAQESIYLTKLETSPVRPVRHMKAKASRKTPDQKREASLSENEKSHKVLEFKLCPEILFRNPSPDEESSATKNTLERDKSVVAGIKSKKEDWLKCDPVKQRKLEGTSAGEMTHDYPFQNKIEDSIPLDTAIQILEGDDEALHLPVKDSKDMFQTYRKMYLEKKCKNLDSIPVS